MYKYTVHIFQLILLRFYISKQITIITKLTFAAERRPLLCVAKCQASGNIAQGYIASILKISQETGDFLRIRGFGCW